MSSQNSQRNLEAEEDWSDQEVSDWPLPAWLEGDSLAPPCQADMDVVRAIIDFAGVTDQDVLFDLGCGDGRICIEAAEGRGAMACGVEIEEPLVDKFRRTVSTKGLESKVSVIHGDLREVDLSEATVVVMYLLPEAIAEIAQPLLLPLLRRGGGCHKRKEPHAEDSARRSSSYNPLEHGPSEGIVGEGAATAPHTPRPCRIVCNTWGIPGATAVREAAVGLYGGVVLRLFTHDSLPTPSGSTAVVSGDESSFLPDTLRPLRHSERIVVCNSFVGIASGESWGKSPAKRVSSSEADRKWP